MKNPKWQELWLIGTYAAVAIIFIILNVTAGQKEGILNLIINLGMLLVALLIFVWTIRKWNNLNVFAEDLMQAEQRIRADYRSKEVDYLGEDYLSEETLFQTPALQSMYRSYVDEAQRRGMASDIEDYINDTVIGKIVSRNVMNQMPGILTGLGILGTFLGLSIGLQYFTTDTSEAIMESIPALMDGIKVAFHTSVYGMILSLSYNYLYKRKLEWAENVMDRFVATFEEKVMPNPQNEAMSLLVEYQKQQSRQMEGFAENLGRQVAEGMGQALAETLRPQFDRFDQTIQRFTDIASQNQTEGMSRVVDSFMNQMNYALGDKFNAFGQIMDQTYQAQKNNADQMQAIMNQSGNMAGNINEIAGVSQRMIEEMESYIRRLENLQEIINQNFQSAGRQLENTQALIEQQNTYVSNMSTAQTELAKAEQEFAALMAEQRYATKESFDGMARHIEELDGIVKSDMTSAAQELRGASDGMADQMNVAIKDSFQVLAEEMAKLREENQNLMSESLTRQIEQFNQISNGVSMNMMQSAEALNRASEGLNPQIMDSFQKTFKLFDRNLAEIEEHLSATITQIHNETKRVPVVVSQAYEGMEKSMNEVNRSMNELSQALQAQQSYARPRQGAGSRMNGYEE